MELEEMEKVYSGFEVWCRKKKGYMSVDGIYLLQLWYEYLEYIKEKV